MRRKLNSPNLSLAISVLLQHFGITESRPWTHRHVQTQSFYVTLYKSINILLGDLCYPFLRTYTITFTKIVSSSFLMPLIQHQHQYSIRGLLSMYVVVQWTMFTFIIYQDANFSLFSDGRLLIELRGDGDRGRWMSAPSNKVSVLMSSDVY